MNIEEESEMRERRRAEQEGGREGREWGCKRVRQGEEGRGGTPRREMRRKRMIEEAKRHAGDYLV